MIMLQGRAIEFGAESFQIGEPLQVRDSKGKPGGEVPYCFQNREIPVVGRVDRLHAGWFGEPGDDRELVAVGDARAPEAMVLQKKPDHVAMPGPCVAAPGLDVTLDQRWQPAPPPTQYATSAGVNPVEGLIASRKTARQGADESGGDHKYLAAEASNQSDFA